MNGYELTVILPEKTTPAKKKAANTSIEKVVKTLKGKIGKVDDWGEVELAYPIKGNTTGTFELFNLELDGKAAKAITQKLNLEEKILRFLLVKKE